MIYEEPNKLLPGCIQRQFESRESQYELREHEEQMCACWRGEPVGWLWWGIKNVSFTLRIKENVYKQGGEGT